MKKVIALALALAMMVSCLVFTASAESSVAVKLEGPETIEAGGVFQVKVRVTDTSGIVGGVQGVINATGATVTSVEVNPEVLSWNKTEDRNTIFKIGENNTAVSFASLNNLDASTTHSTRLWLIITCEADDGASDVAVAFGSVKVSNKEAKLIDGVTTNELNIKVMGAEAPSVSLVEVGIDGKAILATEQAILVNAAVENIADESVTDVGVIFYPTALLGGKDLTFNVDGVLCANINKEQDEELFNKVSEARKFIGALNFMFEDEVNALKFLGYKVTARVYYKTSDGKVIYASNQVAGNDYIINGVANKAALNTILDNGDNVKEPVEGSGTLDGYNNAKIGLNTVNNVDWQGNRAYVLKYCVMNTASK